MTTPPAPDPATPARPHGAQPHGAQSHGAEGFPTPAGAPEPHGGTPHVGAPHAGAPYAGAPAPGAARSYPRPVAYPPPRQVEPVPGTPFVVAYLPTAGLVNGVGVGSLSAGSGSLVVATLVWCFGVAGAEGGWGGVVAGAFTALAGVLGVAAVVLGIVGLRRSRSVSGTYGAVATPGRGTAISGIVCGGVGLLLAGLGLVVAVAVG